MMYRIYNVTRDNQKVRDIAVIPYDNAYEFFQHENLNNYDFDAFASIKGNEELPEWKDLKNMHYYVELKNGTKLYFYQEVNMYKWLYEHHDDFQVESYGKYN